VFGGTTFSGGETAIGMQGMNYGKPRSVSLELCYGLGLSSVIVPLDNDTCNLMFGLERSVSNTSVIHRLAITESLFRQEEYGDEE